MHSPVYVCRITAKGTGWLRDKYPSGCDSGSDMCPSLAAYRSRYALSSQKDKHKRTPLFWPLSPLHGDQSLLL